MTAEHRDALAPVWQRRFVFFDRFRVPSGSKEARDALRAMGVGDRMVVTANGLAFLFGPFYFFAKGMWRKGLVLLIAGFALRSALVVAGVADVLARGPAALAVSLVAMLTANYSFYLHLRRRSRSWNPFEGFVATRPAVA